MKKSTAPNPDSTFVSVYRIGLVRDEHVKFDRVPLCGPSEAQRMIQNLILTLGQPDREQFCVLLLDTKNHPIGVNIVSTGGLSSASVHPREVLKPAILANAAAMILCHNHPSGATEPSLCDKDITERIIKAAQLLGIMVHEHLIINMDNDQYYSFAEQGFIQKIYRKLENKEAI
jgi:DNA repair protein RadC